ncbi:hypothetical protein TNCV_5045861 [Trichonephila clavipes]|uniref:Uncharacterized protein n=1 Tax=Trichonephila clavipes TaxID=2585209 RepID=A0A8X6WHJ0_TRICX|nr:hypothetical protein TNCV_5045861 [Trichonephila clavipes]
MNPNGLVVAYHASTLLVRGSNPGLGKVGSAFHPFNGSITEYQACLGKEHCDVRGKTDHLTGSSDVAPQCSRSRKLRWSQ